MLIAIAKYLEGTVQEGIEKNYYTCNCPNCQRENLFEFGEVVADPDSTFTLECPFCYKPGDKPYKFIVEFK